MGSRLKTVLLLDDNSATNFLHKKVIMQTNRVENVVAFQSGVDALAYLDSSTEIYPELIFVDINMPIMDAWDFLDEYQEIDREEKQKTKIILLTTSMSPGDKERADRRSVINDTRLKLLDMETIENLIDELFPDS